ncbi:MAG: cytidine deaminase [Spirochaetes bacterium]|nr:cytidine deaminase [Spirochaetota bacterium]
MSSNAPYTELIEAARKAAELAYAPYSHFRVGAALLCKDGSIVTGINIENRSFGLTVCAERVAIFSALSQGKQKFTALAIVCLDADYPVSPCGACRQVISEFVPKDFPIVFAGGNGSFIRATLEALYPYDALHELRKNG